MGRFRLSIVANTILCLALVAMAPTPGRADPPPFAERLPQTGLPMLGRVHAGLYRGSHPEGEEGYAALRERGIKTVISLSPRPGDPALLDRYGLRSETIPMSPERPPTPRQQREFLALVTDTGWWPIYVHCARGRDRTGVMLALYRVRVEGWSRDEAIAEMRSFGHAYRAYPALERFIRALPETDGDTAAEPAAAPPVRTIEFVGHRGFSERYPENTLLALEEAFRRGVNYCEVDATVTRDDVYVLFHDQPTMYRTSNGYGYILNSRYADLQQLDFGAWKGDEFAGTPVATLREAMVLAEKYDAHLYLDTKTFRADLLAQLLRETGVNPNRILPSIYTLAEAADFRNHCPNSPWVWFGGLPEDPADDTWYAERIALGCTIFEFYYTKALADGDTYPIFRDKVHAAGAKIWVFAVNTETEALALAEVGVDGMETDNAIALTDYFKGRDPEATDAGHNGSAVDRLTTANYRFDKPDLFSTGIGSQLRPFAYFDTALIQNVSFGTTAQFGIAPLHGMEGTVMHVPAFNPDNGLMLFPNFLPRLEEDLHYDYTVLLDLYLPATADTNLASLFQTNPDNTNDGDLFIGLRRGVGIANEYHGAITPDTWSRLAVVVSRTAITTYLNGVLVGEHPIAGGRWAVYNTFPGGQNQGFLLFADDDSETLELYVHALQVRNYALSGDEVASLGTPLAPGIPINNTGLYFVTVSGETGTGSIVNWDEKTVTTTFPDGYDLSAVTVNFTTSYGATTSLAPGSTLDLRSAAGEIVVTAEDGLTRTAWQLLVAWLPE